MKINFNLKENYLFDTYKAFFIKQWKIKQVKIIWTCIFLISFSIFTFYLHLNYKNIYISVTLLIFFFIFIILYLKFIDYSFDKSIRKYISKTTSCSIWKENFFELSEEYTRVWDLEWNLEIKIKNEKTEIIDDKNYFFLFSKENILLFLPKEILTNEQLLEVKKIYKI